VVDGDDQVVSEQGLARIRVALREAAVSHRFLQLDAMQLQVFGADLCDHVVLAGDSLSGSEAFPNRIRDGDYFPGYSGGFPEAVVQESESPPNSPQAPCASAC
jgi:hypothetical protein